MTLDVQRLEVGPWPMNCYLVRCLVTGQVAVVDPGADPDAILEAVGTAPLCCILVTHGHPDHVGALEAVCSISEAPVGVHPADASTLESSFGLKADFPLVDSMQIEVGQGRLRVVHVPGHTPGSICLLPVQTRGRRKHTSEWALVGDAIFPGGPGHTKSHAELRQSLTSLACTVFTWPDGTQLLPGHGPGTTVRAERAAFEAFMDSDLSPHLQGDVTWR
ncbi:MAG TPA: MBL fold metallo-hydrolase [Anaerolineae bacterium]|nr:MBL fold metallo-hydrolase [Anaerolineae bacterium]